MKYRVFITDRSTSEIWELPFLSIRFTEELNKDKDADFSFDLEIIDTFLDEVGITIDSITSAAIRHIYIEDEEENVVYYGVLSDQNESKDSKKSYKLTLASVGVFSMLQKAIVGKPLKEYLATDAGAMSWDMIDEYQNSDAPYSNLGITEGSITATKNRDRTLRFRRIKDVIEKMSAEYLEDGFDFDVDNSLAFNVYAQKGSERPEIILEDGFNILTWTLHKPLVSALTNKVYVIGAGQNDDDLLWVTREAAATYKSSFGLLEEVLSEKEIITTDTLNDYGDKLLSDEQAPKYGLVVTLTDESPMLTDYSVGDWLKVRIAKKNIDAFYRVRQRTVNIEANGSVVVTLTLEP